MNRHQRKTKQTAPILLALSLLIMLTVFPTVTAHAAGWLNNVNSLTLGNAVSGSIMEGDYYGATEYNSDKYYWHIYRFTMPQNGLLNVYIESASSEYLRYYYSVNGFAIFSGADPDNIPDSSNTSFLFLLPSRLTNPNASSCFMDLAIVLYL